MYIYINIYINIKYLNTALCNSEGEKERKKKRNKKKRKTTEEKKWKVPGKKEN